MTKLGLLRAIEEILEQPAEIPPVAERAGVTPLVWRAIAIFDLVSKTFEGEDPDELKREIESLRQEVTRLREAVPVNEFPPDP